MRRSRFSSRALCLALLGSIASGAAAQRLDTRWVAIGDLHNGYASVGAECEACLVNAQQYGWRWPGLNPYADLQVSKGLWLGAQNVPDDKGGGDYDVRVVHVGPRVRGGGEVFPTRFELATRFPIPSVTVEGRPSVPEALMTPDVVDPTLPADVVLTSEMNTLLGVSVTRRVLQFAQEHHDDYHLIEYTLTNTGNTDDDEEVERPDQTVEGLTLFLMDRLAIAREGRYVVANSTGWGKNTMNDARGDGTASDATDESFRAQYSWHGLSVDSSLPYDNLGASAQASTILIAPADTVGRLTASQFAGVVTIHADASATSESDDPAQPTTTTWFSSDDPLLSNNDASNRTKMAAEYALMTSGHRDRHATTVEPAGLTGFLDPANDPSLGTPGGHSFGNGYGPYTLAPGESVRVVIAEAANGLSREANTQIGRAFKRSGNDADAELVYAGERKTKNEWIFTGRDSLFQTFRRAIANVEAGYAAPRPPGAPSSFDVVGTGEGVRLAWTPPEQADRLAGFEIYRAAGRADTTYTQILATGPATTAFEDRDVDVGVPYFYHIVSVGSSADNDGAALTPPGALRSSPYLTQTYTGVVVHATGGEPAPDASRLEVLLPTPHPIRGEGAVRVRLPTPAVLTLTVYSVTGREVARLAVGAPLPAGPSEFRWSMPNVAPGVYVLRASAGGETASRRVVVVR